MRRLALVAALMIFGLAGGTAAQDAATEAQIRSVLAKNPDIVQDIVRDYLLKNPDLVRKILVEMIRQKSKAAAPMPDHAASIRSNAATLFSSKHQTVIGNPDGDVTLVEFFDYNCGFCKRSLSDKLELLKSDPSLRIVLKDYPVLGKDSLDAARIAIALRMQSFRGDRFLEFHKRLLEARRSDGATALIIARDLGADMVQIERDLSSDEIRTTVEENTALGRNLGITGTPSYVVGNTVESGAVGLAVLAERVKAARR